MDLMKQQKGDRSETLACYLLRVVLRLIRDSRWRKKCKKLIKRVRGQLVIQKKRRDAIIRQSEADINELHNHGHHKHAVARVEQLQKDQHVLYAYQQIEDFCDCIYQNLLKRQSKMTVEVAEAVSSLLFAASRCGELSELTRIRAMLTKCFGNEFERMNVELYPGNCVNTQLIYNLGNNKVPKEKRLQYSSKIAQEYTKFEPPCYKTTEGKDDSLNSVNKDIRKVGKNDSIIKQVFSIIGSAFSSFSSTHLGTIHADSSDRILSRDRDLARGNGEEDEESKPRLSYVHPKLPDYDKLVATFTGYKEDHCSKRP